jgi:hypothetical protein
MIQVNLCGAGLTLMVEMILTVCLIWYHPDLNLM